MVHKKRDAVHQLCQVPKFRTDTLQHRFILPTHWWSFKKPQWFRLWSQELVGKCQKQKGNDLTDTGTGSTGEVPYWDIMRDSVEYKY